MLLIPKSGYCAVPAGSRRPRWRRCTDGALRRGACLLRSPAPCNSAWRRKDRAGAVQGRSRQRGGEAGRCRVCQFRAAETGDQREALASAHATPEARGGRRLAVDVVTARKVAAAQQDGLVGGGVCGRGGPGQGSGQRGSWQALQPPASLHIACAAPTHRALVHTQGTGSSPTHPCRCCSRRQTAGPLQKGAQGWGCCLWRPAMRSRCRWLEPPPPPPSLCRRWCWCGAWRPGRWRGEPLPPGGHAASTAQHGLVRGAGM